MKPSTDPTDSGPFSPVLLNGGLFCSADCAEGLQADRRMGLILGPYPIRDDAGLVGYAKSAEQFSRLTLCCAYCAADLPEDAADELLADFYKAPRG